VVGSRAASDASELSAYAFFLEEGGRRPDDGCALSASDQVTLTSNASRAVLKNEMKGPFSPKQFHKNAIS